VDELQLKIRGEMYWLWWAVDQDGWVLDILVQERRNEQAAVAFLRRVLAAAGGAPRVIVTDKLPATCQPCGVCCRRLSIGATNG
jgi:putative transposase